MKFKIERKRTLIERYKKRMELVNHIKKLGEALKKGKRVCKKVDISKNRKQFLLLFDDVQNMSEMGKRLNLKNAALYQLMYDLEEYEIDEVTEE